MSEGRTSFLNVQRVPIRGRFSLWNSSTTLCVGTTVSPSKNPDGSTICPTEPLDMFFRLLGGQRAMVRKSRTVFLMDLSVALRPCSDQINPMRLHVKPNQLCWSTKALENALMFARKHKVRLCRARPSAPSTAKSSHRSISRPPPLPILTAGSQRRCDSGQLSLVADPRSLNLLRAWARLACVTVRYLGDPSPENTSRASR